MVVAASAVHSLHAACAYIGPTTLVSPIRHSLNLTVSQATRPLIAFRAVQAIFLLPVGFILDRHPQFFLRAAMLFAALLSPLLSVSTSLTQLIIIQTFLGVTKLFGGLSVMLILITRVFPDGQGHASATGILLSGYSFAGFLAPALIGLISQHTSWRIASAFLALLFVTIALPLTFYFLREERPTRPFSIPALHATFMRLISNAWRRIQLLRPQFLRLNQDDIDADEDSARLAQLPRLRILDPNNEPKTSNAAVSGPIMRRTPSSDMNGGVISVACEKGKALPPVANESEAVLSPGFLVVLIIVGTYSFSVFLIFDHLIVFMGEDVGLRFDAALMRMSMLNLIALFSKLGVGPLADRYNKTLLLALFSLLSCFSCLLLLDISGTSFSTTISTTKINCFTVICMQVFFYVFLLPCAYTVSCNRH